MKCRNCGANQESNQERCQYCGTVLPPKGADTRVREQMKTLLQGWSSVFRDVEEQAENRGVSMMFWGFGLLGFLLIGLRLWANWGWIALIIGAVVGFFVVLFASIDIGDRYARRDAERVYREQIRPQVEAYLAAEEVERWELLEVAQQSLGRRKQLRQFLMADGQSFD